MFLPDLIFTSTTFFGNIILSLKIGFKIFFSLENIPEFQKFILLFIKLLRVNSDKKTGEDK
jgi:hypothetical protein